METIDVALNDFALRCRSLLVSHISAALPRGLEPGEQVLLHDRRRGWFTGHVANISFEPADTVYRVKMGVRLTDDEARERRRATAESQVGSLSQQDVLDLLGELRAASRTIPVAVPRRRRSDTAL
jgi:hypothetical protein